jgi:hypothetical protein
MTIEQQRLGQETKQWLTTLLSSAILGLTGSHAVDR